VAREVPPRHLRQVADIGVPRCQASVSQRFADEHRVAELGRVTVPGEPSSMIQPRNSTRHTNKATSATTGACVLELTPCTCG
jgi:hypothetical protein